MQLVYKVMGSDQMAESVAKMLWNIYSKSKKEGFTDDQAMTITLSFAKSYNK